MKPYFSNHCQHCCYFALICCMTGNFKKKQRYKDRSQNCDYGINNENLREITKESQDGVIGWDFPAGTNNVV